jgi:two-component system LytT family sensor kinase
MQLKPTAYQRVNSFLFTLFGFEKARSKFHIVLITLIHLGGWCLFFFLPVFLYPVRFADRSFIDYELIDKFTLVILFYLNYYLFVPRFFEKKKYLAYILAVVFAFIFYLAQHLVVDLIRFEKKPGPFGRLYFSQPPMTATKSLQFSAGLSREGAQNNVRVKNYMAITSAVNENELPDSVKNILPFPPIADTKILGIPKGMILVSINRCLSSFALFFLIGGFLRLAHSFVRSQNEKKALENARLNAEVNFLKSQINPHFLFNTLNSIYSQAHLRSAETEYSILKLSDLLRYVLYDSSMSKVDLSKDIQYLTNYIDLQKIRLSHKVTVRYDMAGNTHGKKIAPLLLITFVENAFKHGISYTSSSAIGISINIFEKSLRMVVTNSVIESNSFENNGLGLKNVMRRLELLYPGKYLLDIVHNDHLYTVNLKIDLE